MSDEISGVVYVVLLTTLVKKGLLYIVIQQ